jgi:hypothetical protein
MADARWTEVQTLAWIVWRDPERVARYAESKASGGARGAAARRMADLLYMPPATVRTVDLAARPVEYDDWRKAEVGRWEAARKEFQAWPVRGRTRTQPSAIRAQWPRMTEDEFVARAKAAGQPVDRDKFVLECGEATGCKRERARELFASLDPALKRPRGRPKAEG